MFCSKWCNRKRSVAELGMVVGCLLGKTRIFVCFGLLGWVGPYHIRNLFTAISRPPSSPRLPTETRMNFWNCHLAILCWVAKPIFLTLRMPVAWSRRHLGGSEPTPGTTSQSILLSLHLQRATCRNGCGKTTSMIPLIIFVFAEFGSPVFVQVYLEGSWPWKWMSVWLLEEFLQRFQLLPLAAHVIAPI